ncbi:MAG: extracellular solute-binding protein [Ruminococcus sp.]|nr:extracellular solute-binding protein [Ruminococcus sp.]
MNKFKRMLAGTMAMACMISTVSCFESKKISEIKTEQQPSPIQEKTDIFYKSVEIEANLPFSEIQNIISIGDTGNILISGYALRNNQYFPHAYITDSEFSDFREIDLELGEYDLFMPEVKFAVTSSGKIFAVVTVVDHSNLVLPDFNSENVNYEALYAAANKIHTIYTFDEKGKVTSKNTLTGIDEYRNSVFEGEQVALNDCFALGKDKVCLSIRGTSRQIYVTADADGNLSDPVTFGMSKALSPYGTDRDNNLAYVAYEDSGRFLKTMNGDTLEISPDFITLDNTSHYSSILKGEDDYRLYLSGTAALYGIKDDGTMTEVINWFDCDITGSFIAGITPVENGDFIVIENNQSTKKTTVFRLTKRDTSEIENLQIINMVMEYSDQRILEKVKDFNRANDEYRIKVEDYNQYNVVDKETNKLLNTADKQLGQDIEAGKDVDIIYVSGSSSALSTLSKNGKLADLYEFIDKDDELTRDDFVPMIFSTCENNGKLTMLPPSFYISTLACKSKYFDKENWTVDEFIETCRNLPEGMKPFKLGNTKTDIFSHLIYSSNDFVDFNNSACNFDSPDFIKVLEFCNEYYNAGEGGEIDVNTATEDEANAYWAESIVAVRNDKALLSEITLDTARAYVRAVQAEFGDEITLVGNPTSDGSGARIQFSDSYAIMESSDCKDTCWEFISEIFSEEHQSSEDIYDFPVITSAFEKKLDETMENPYYTDESGNKVEYEDIYYLSGKEIIVSPLTKQERDYIEDYIRNAKPVPFYYNEDINNVILEEVEAYFAGSKTADKTAKALQNRVSALLSEQS